MKTLSPRIGLRSLTLVIGLAATPFGIAASQTLETETARLLPAKGIKFGGNFERQTSSDGRETAVPMFFEVGLSNRTELVIEPVAYTGIRPKVGPRATGVGDLEITLVERLFVETPSRPVGSRTKLSSEILANTSATSAGESSSTPEVSGDELVGTLAMAASLARHANPGAAMIGTNPQV